MGDTRARPPRSTSFLVATLCTHGVVPRRVGMPLDEYDAGERRFVRAHLPGADPDRDIVVTLRGDELGLRWQHRFDGLDCGSGATHCVTFEKHFRVPAGLTPDDFEAEHGDGVLLVSWPAVPSSATARLRGEPVERRVVVDLTGSPK